MPIARILKPAKTAMSSGLAQTKSWVLVYEQETRRRPDPLMGWTSAEDTLNQIRLRFDSLDEAKAYADANGLTYTVEEPRQRRFKAKSYADNFRNNRVLF